jgi:hypothetical protein
MITRDNVLYEEGMTLFSVLGNLGNYLLCTHVDTHLNGVNRWQTDGSPGTHGYVNDCFAAESSAKAHIVQQIKTKIERLQLELKKWET